MAPAAGARARYDGRLDQEEAKMAFNLCALQQVRIVLAFLIAAALPGFAASLPWLREGWWTSGLSIMAVGLKITVPPTLLVALPIYLWLRKKGQLRLWWAILAGGAAGVSVSLYAMMSWIWRFGAGKSLGEIWRGSLAYTEPAVFIAIGMICGLAGWLIAYGLRVEPRPGCAA
jgi:hypothetical protein